MHVALCQPFTESLLSPGQLSQALSAGESRAMTRPSLSLSARTTLESHSQGTCVDRMHMHVYVHGCVCVERRLPANCWICKVKHTCASDQRRFLARPQLVGIHDVCAMCVCVCVL